MAAGTHPDYRAVYSEEGKAIPIDTVRALCEALSMKSQLASLQVVIISPADKMNRFSANSLLKTLEEPTPNTLLILVTNQVNRLLPTIRSRCQLVLFTTPTSEQAGDWLHTQCAEKGVDIDRASGQALLDLAGNAPLTALAYAESGALERREILISSMEKLARRQADPIVEVQNWLEPALNQSLNWLTLWVMEMIRLKSGATMVDNRVDASGQSSINSVQKRLGLLAETLDLRRLFDYLDKLTESTRLLDSQVNPQLMMEDVLISWSRLTKV